MSDVLDNAVAGSGKDYTQCEPLTSPEEDILLNADAEIVADDTFNEDEWYDELDSGNNLETDILEINDCGKELDAEKSNDSEEGEESPAGRGKFFTERVTSPSPGDSSDVKRKRLIRNETNKNVQKVYPNSNKRIHSHFNNRNISNTGPRARYNHHNNRFRFHHANGPPRFRPNVNYPQQQMFRAEFNSFNSIQSMMPPVAMMQNNGNFHNICPENMQQYPMYPQYVVNQNPTAFQQNPFVIPNQVQMSQQIHNAFVKSVPYIANQEGCGVQQFSAPVQSMVMQSGFPVQQQIRMPLAMSMQTQNVPSSDFNLTVTTATNTNLSESRKVLINPHFKGKVDVQNARLIWDSHTKEVYGHNRNNERWNMDDNELLRQQEEFINQNRRNLQKRMQGPPRNLYREPFDRSYKSPPRFRNPASGSNIKRNITKNETNSKTTHIVKSSVAVEPKEFEDEETKEYRKRVEDQQRKRDLFLKQKEERRRQRMQKGQTNVDSTIKDNASLPTEANLDVTIISGFKEENVQNRLNKPVHRTGVLNLKTGLIKPKTDPKPNMEAHVCTSDKAICVKTENVTAVSKINSKSNKLHDVKSMPITVFNKNSKLQCNKRQVPSNNLLQNTSENSDVISLVDNDNIENVEHEQLFSSAVEQESAQKSVESKAGFLGRRMVIASNISKHNIVDHTESSPSKMNPESKSAGLFSKVVVNQEFSDEEDLLTFLDETL